MLVRDPIERFLSTWFYYKNKPDTYRVGFDRSSFAAFVDSFFKFPYRDMCSTLAEYRVIFHPDEITDVVSLGIPYHRNKSPWTDVPEIPDRVREWAEIDYLEFKGYDLPRLHS
jgi:hypothetical protein